MALIIEDGTIVDGANTFVDVDTARDYAAARGVTLPADGPTVEAMLITSGDYLNSLEFEYSGARVEPLVQTMCFPRKDAEAYGTPLADDVIPGILERAQCQLCIEVHNGIPLFPSHAAGSAAVKKEKVGPIETEFSESSTVSLSSPLMTSVAALLQPLFGYRGAALRTQRV